MSISRRSFLILTSVFVLLSLTGACSGRVVDSISPEVTQAISLPDSTAISTDEQAYPNDNQLTQAEIATLASLQQVDNYPLYTMNYTADYRSWIGIEGGRQVLTRDQSFATTGQEHKLHWSCSLFTALADPANRLFGRNFDWEFSPALLLFTHPPYGYASVTMVDIAYLGFDGEAAFNLTDRPISELVDLLNAPFLPFDGMNEAGLAIGMAAVPDGNMSPDPTKPTIDSVGIIREMLDHAANVEEALEIIRSYNVSMEGGPPIHYLFADASGKAVLVEYYQGETIVIPNEDPWHLATNFLRADLGESAEGECWRYDRILTLLEEGKGNISAVSALDLLNLVSQDGTQWSVVYGISDGSIEVVMGRNFDRPHHFNLTRSE